MSMTLCKGKNYDGSGISVKESKKGLCFSAMANMPNQSPKNQMHIVYVNLSGEGTIM